MNSYEYLKKLSESKKNINLKDNEIPESSFLAFTIGATKMHIKASEIKEIIPNPEITPIAHAKSWLGGLIKVQGDIYSAVNLWVFLYPDSPVIKNKFALALANDSGNYAILVTNVIGIVKVAVIKDQIKKEGYLEIHQYNKDEVLKVVSTENLIKSSDFIDVSIF